MPIARKHRQTLPTRVKKVPSVIGHFSFLLHVMRKPVATPEKVDPADGTMSQMPESVALCNSTAWKKMGTLKRMALTTTAARKLPKIRLARGACVMMLRGMMGLFARDSVHMKRGVLRRKTRRELMTMGCVQG